MTRTPPPSPFLDRVRQSLDALPAAELAALSQVSNATATRFVRRLGYASLEEARRHARDERSSGSPLFPKALEAGAPAEPAR